MKRIVSFFGFSLIGVLLFACAPKVGPIAPLEEKPVQIALPLAKEGWEAEWQKTLALARKDGKVHIYSFLGPRPREKLGEGFKKKYGLDVEWTTGSGTELSQKILTEKKAGLVLADMTLFGATTKISVLKPAGVLDRMEPELLLQEVTDLSKWMNSELPWIDREHLVLAPAQTPSSNTLINTDRVSSLEITSYRDFLNPKWKGRIVIMNPTRPGSSAKWMSVVGMEIMREDYIRELVKQELAIVSDPRIVVEWVTRGKADIAIAPQSEIVSDFVDAGLINLQLLTPREGGYQSGGNSIVALIKKSPHPYARKVFINWYLSREGQQIMADYDWRQGNRLDIDTGKIPEAKKRQPGIKYFSPENVEFLLKESKFIETIKEIFAPYMR